MLSTSKSKTFRFALAEIEKIDSVKIESTSEDYIHATFQSRLFRFVDDVELKFEIHSSGTTLHIRSASRVGRSDLGANKKRVDSLLAKFKKGLNQN